MKFALLLAALMVATPAAAYYKCTDANGDLKYQNKPCDDGHAQEPLGGEAVEAQPPTPPKSCAPLVSKDPLVEKCFNYQKARLKDPSSAFLESGVVAPKALKSGVLGRWVILSVNAKNSYGAYAGADTYWCVMSQQGQILPDSEMVE